MFSNDVIVSLICSVLSVIPFMQPGNLSFMALSNSSGDIQRPSWLTPPSRGEGTVSLWSRVTITVLLSTRATSRGSVLANQLREKEGKRKLRLRKHEDCFLKNVSHNHYKEVQGVLFTIQICFVIVIKHATVWGNKTKILSLCLVTNAPEESSTVWPCVYAFK